MPPRGSDGRFVREEERLNIDLDIFTILKYLIVLAAIFPWCNIKVKTEILKTFDTSCLACECSANEFPIHECSPCIYLANETGKLG